MHQLYNNKLPKVFTNKLTKLENIHSYETRRPNKLNYFLQRLNKTAGQNKLNFLGAKLWNEINEKLRYKHFNSFKKLYKEILIKDYWHDQSLS